MARSVSLPKVGTVGIEGVGTVQFIWKPQPEEVAAQILALASELEDTSDPMRLSREIAIKDNREHFETNSGPTGIEWAPWARSYAYKAAKTNVDILERHGQTLRKSIEDPTAYPISDDTLWFSTGGLPHYWVWNYEGSSANDGEHAGEVDSFREGMRAAGEPLGKGGLGIGSGNALPARPMIGLTAEGQAEILATFEQWFDGAINTAFMRRGKFVGQHRAPSGRFAKKP